MRLFWTGGWDSTYRLVELSRMDLTVEPVYCIDKGRGSLEIERAAMKNILRALQDKPETKAKILPVKEIDIETLPENKEITEAYNTVCKSVRLGSQYEWLAKVALDYPGIELGIEYPDGTLGGCTSALNQFAEMKQTNGIWKIDCDSSSKECCLIFGNINFPIIDISELEMQKNIEKWNYEDVMSNIWFCLNPINNRPCGKCEPCKQKIERSMGWLLPPEAHKRYRRYKTFERISKIPVIGFMFRALRYVYRRIRRIFSGSSDIIPVSSLRI